MLALLTLVLLVIITKNGYNDTKDMVTALVVAVPVTWLAWAICDLLGVWLLFASYDAPIAYAYAPMCMLYLILRYTRNRRKEIELSITKVG